MPPGWGAALASSCPHLTALSVHTFNKDYSNRSFPANSVLNFIPALSPTLTSDIQALRSLALVTLDLEENVDVTMLQAIGQMSSLRCLALRGCNAAFEREGVLALSRLHELTKLTLTPGDRMKNSKDAPEAVEILLRSLLKLENLDLQVSFLAIGLARALAHHHCLSSLSMCLAVTGIAETSAVATLLSESKSISSLKFPFCCVHVPLKCLQGNVHILDTNLFFGCTSLEVTERKQLQRLHEARNRRLLHNWQCISVLLASYRANAHSPIRDSMLSLMMDVMSFLVPDEWCVERCV
jgi:hypothetical protein